MWVFALEIINSKLYFNVDMEINRAGKRPRFKMIIFMVGYRQQKLFQLKNELIPEVPWESSGF